VLVELVDILRRGFAEFVSHGMTRTINDIGARCDHGHGDDRMRESLSVPFRILSLRREALSVHTFARNAFLPCEDIDEATVNCNVFFGVRVLIQLSVDANPELLSHF